MLYQKQKDQNQVHFHLNLQSKVKIPLEIICFQPKVLHSAIVLADPDESDIMDQVCWDAYLVPGIDKPGDN